MVTPPAIRPELDGLRALSVWAVMLVHAGAPMVSAGWLGVDVFFVLSGFLITTLLLDEHRLTGRVALGAFWLRRALRLMPAYLVYAAIVTLLFLADPPPAGHVHQGWTPAGYLAAIWTYTINFVPKGGVWDHQDLTLHLWSLAVEQQFYLVLPLTLLLGWRLGLSPFASIVGLGICLIGLSFLDWLPGAPEAKLTTRGLSLLAGCAVAALAAGAGQASAVKPPWLARLHVFCCGLSIALALGIMLASEVGRGPDLNGLLQPHVLLWASMAGTIAGYWYGWSSFGSRLLGRQVLIRTGRISYGMYLYHMMAWVIVFRVLFENVDFGLNRYFAYGIKLGTYVLLTYLFALVSYELIEKRFLRLKNRFHVQRSDVGRGRAETMPGS